MSSSRACQRCKSRHVKCDEKRPSCEQCKSLDLDCPGYSDKLKFVDEGARIEQRYKKRPNDSPFKRLRLGQSTFRVLQTPASVSKSESATSAATASGAERLSHVDGDVRLPSHEQTARLPTISDIVSSRVSMENAQSGDRAYDVRSDAQSPQFGASASPFSDLYTNTPSGFGSASFIDSTDFSFGEFISEFMIESEQEILFLVRHFTDNIAPWLDLFDHATFFEAFVPTMVQTNPMLKYATAAIAAKQLGRVGGVRASRLGPSRHPGVTESYPDSGRVDWSYKAANYYYQALNCLRRVLPDQGATVQCEPSVPRSRTVGEIVQKPRTSYFAAGCLPEICMVSDTVLAASSILSIYECLDSSETAWSQHLNGVQCLLEAAILPKPANSIPTPLNLPALCHAKRACFWNFAREDYLAAYVTKKRTRFNTKDLQIWREAGLEFDPEGMPDFSSMETTSPSVLCPAERENIISNSLVWMLSSIVNLLVVIAEEEEAKEASPSNFTAPSAYADAEWKRLWQGLELWYAYLPMEFEPYGRLQLSDNFHAFSPDSAPFQEILFSKSSSAATIQHYHFARILLLLNRQSGTGTPATRLRAYREMMKDVNNHAREICGIATGRPGAAARIHMLQPLHLAGQVLEDDQERKTIVQLLQDIEADLGWSTEYRVTQLLEEWKGPEAVEPMVS